MATQSDAVAQDTASKLPTSSLAAEATWAQEVGGVVVVVVDVDVVEVDVDVDDELDGGMGATPMGGRVVDVVVVVVAEGGPAVGDRCGTVVVADVPEVLGWAATSTAKSTDFASPAARAVKLNLATCSTG